MKESSPGVEHRLQIRHLARVIDARALRYMRISCSAGSAIRLCVPSTWLGFSLMRAGCFAPALRVPAARVGMDLAYRPLLALPGVAGDAASNAHLAMA